MNPTIFEAYNQCKKELDAAGIADYVFESKQIIKHVTGLSSAQILSRYNEQLTDFQLNNLTAIKKQRLIRYPLQYIFGTWGFYGLDFAVGPGVLIPRSDTETVVDVCLEFLKDKTAPKVLDLCCGSGCIGIAVAANKPDSDVTLVDKYTETLSYAVKNISLNNVKNCKTEVSDVLDIQNGEEKYDLIVSNPPYITDEDMKSLQPEVAFEPKTALAGGTDGLDFYKAIVKNYSRLLKNGGMLCFEVGAEQAEDVKRIMSEKGYENISFRKDASEIDRVVFGTLSKI